MADPLAERCLYCGSRDVLDDAWWCDTKECERRATDLDEFTAVLALADECGQVDTFALLLADRDALATSLGDVLGRLHRLSQEQRDIVLTDVAASKPNLASPGQKGRSS